MNQQRLDELTKRAERAKELAQELAQLQAADPQVGSHNYTFRSWNTATDHWPDKILKQVLSAGRRAVIAEKERELEQLLGVELPPSKPVETSATVSILPCDPIGERECHSSPCP